MTALNDQWQAARKSRYDEVTHRRSQVTADLQRWQTDRLVRAVQLRQSLAEMYIDLRDEMDLWLTQIAQQRKARAKQVRLSLQQYVQQLETETQAMLKTFEADRIAETAALQQQLQQDCQAIKAAVSEMRLDIAQELRQIQQRVKSIQKQAGVDRAGYRQEQAIRRAELLPELANYVADLQVQVKTSLEEMAVVRQQAATIQRQQRQHDRQALTEAVDQIFDQLADFRQDLQTQREAITLSIWGDQSVVIPAAAPVQTSPVKPTAAPVAKPQGFAHPKAVEKPSAPSP